MVFPEVITKIAITIRQHGGELFVVGGAVRDTMMGIKPKDIDFVFTGITPETFINIANKFGKVSADTTPSQIGVMVTVVHIGGEMFEFAAARSEVSTGPKKLDVIVTPTDDLRQDAERRDVTINAMFIRVIDGVLIDPLNGAADITGRMLRPTPHFHFSNERVLRVAAMSAIMGFDIAPEIVTLAKCMSKAAVKGDQIWRQGWAKLARATEPERFFAFLGEVGWFAGFNPVVVVGKRGLPEIFSAILNEIGLERFEQLAKDVFMPNDVKAAAIAFGKPDWTRFKAIAGRVVMAREPNRKPGKWVSDVVNVAFAMACASGKVELTDAEIAGFVG